MFATDVATAISTLPTPGSAGTPGWFTNGNPGGGVPATEVDADFLNMVQDELLAIVTAAGETPSKTARDQLITGLKSLFVPKIEIYVGSPFAGTGAYQSLAQLAFTMPIAGGLLVEGNYHQQFGSGFAAWSHKLTLDLAGADTDYSALTFQAIDNAPVIRAFIPFISAAAHTLDLMWDAPASISANPVVLTATLIF
jgi:hypothetical protein